MNIKTLLLSAALTGAILITTPLQAATEIVDQVVAIVDDYVIIFVRHKASVSFF